MAEAAVKAKPETAPEAEQELTDGFHLIIDALKRAAEGTANTMPYLLDAVRAYATIGEICGALREVLEHRVSGVAHQAHATLRPVLERVPVVESPLRWALDQAGTHLLWMQLADRATSRRSHACHGPMKTGESSFVAFDFPRHRDTKIILTNCLRLTGRGP